MFSFIVDILHMILAGALSLISIEYEREQGCDPVQVQPAHYEIMVEDAGAPRPALAPPPAPPALEPVSDCARSSGPVSLPRGMLRV